MGLAPYAVSDENSKGRQYDIENTNDRSSFRVDYTRIIHSEAFRRLQNKTQVFANYKGDIFRTRMSHSLEVAQFAKTIAEFLGLNQDLSETLAVGHDLGHPPFGHRGQDKLDELMKDYGGFEHNEQALRLVDILEKPYREHTGLNLMFETREGLLKHCTKASAEKLGEVAQRHLLGQQPPLEVQLVDMCDALAYVHADLEDAYMMGILPPSKLLQAPGFMEAFERAKKAHPLIELPCDEVYNSQDFDKIEQMEQNVRTVIREMIKKALNDLKYYSLKNLQENNIQSLDDVRNFKSELITFSPEHLELHKELKKYSRREIYHHPSVDNERLYHEKMIIDLFKAYVDYPDLVSGRPLKYKNEAELYRAVADHISGMTDRYAIKAHEYLQENHPKLVTVFTKDRGEEEDFKNKKKMTY